MLATAGSRPSTGVRNGSPESDPWWGTQDARSLKRTIEQARAAGNYAAVAEAARRGYEFAIRKNARAPAVRYLITLGSARMLMYRYRESLEAYAQARKLAASLGDRDDEGAILANLSSLYLEMSDLDSAVQFADQARRLVRGHPYFEYQLQLQLGKLYALTGDQRAEAMFTEEIDAARAHSDFRQEARGWDYLGDLRVREGRLDDADRAFSEAFRIRTMLFKADLPYSYARLGSLRLAQRRMDDAGRFTDLAIRAGDRIESAFPKFLLVHQRGKIRLAQGDQDGALADFGTAVDLASTWRREALPAISTLTATNVELEKSVFDSLIETAAAKGRVEESLQAVEENRAASLRASIALASAWRKRVPGRYWDVLGELRAEQARLARTGEKGSAALERSRSELTEMEAEAGLRFFTKNKENFLTQKTLIHFQRVLSASDLYLSFHVGRTASYVWAVTSESAAMHRLASTNEIRVEVSRFRDAVRDGRPDAAESGEGLYADLFGKLGPRETGKRNWLISADDVLLEAPLSALVTERKGRLEYLVERHSLQLVPGAQSLAEGQTRPVGGWLGVGDPIYNSADTRLNARPRYLGWIANAAGMSGQLSRLPASAEELRVSAQSWGAKSTILQGANATLQKFQAATAPTKGQSPAAIHLATHILTPADRPGQALIAFGLDSTGTPQFLSTSDVAMMRVPGAVIAMTGCASGAGEIREGAGLLGLTRAWQMAGASAVISTLWPVADSQGDIFEKFYRFVQDMTPADALRRSQMAMISSGTWRASPQYWASYQISGGSQ